MTHRTISSILFLEFLLPIVAWAGQASTVPSAPATQILGSAPSTRPAGDEAEIRHMLKQRQVWFTVQTFVPLDDWAYGETPMARQCVQVFGDYARATHATIEPIRRRFGDKALEPLHLKFPTLEDAEKQMGQMGDPTFKFIDTVAITIHGDTAEIRSDPNEKPLVLRRINGHWKAPFSEETLLAQPGMTKEALPLGLAAYAEAAKQLGKLAKDIDAGTVSAVNSDMWPDPEKEFARRVNQQAKWRTH